jgi:hypothetical protein
MIPGNAFAVGQAPASALIPLNLFGFPVTLSYREGADIFNVEDQVPPFTLDVVSAGPLSATIEAGTGEDGFGFRVNLIRDGVYGTVLVDRINMERDIVDLDIEYCPDITEDTEESTSSVSLTSVESCPDTSVVTEETRVSILSNLVSE